MVRKFTYQNTTVRMFNILLKFFQRIFNVLDPNKEFVSSNNEAMKFHDTGDNTLVYGKSSLSLGNSDLNVAKSINCTNPDINISGCAEYYCPYSTSEHTTLRIHASKITAKLTSFMIPFLQLRNFAAYLILMVLLSAHSFAADVDLAISQQINNSTPQIGDQVTYTIYLKNQGNTDAGNTIVHAQLPFGAVGNINPSSISGTVNNLGGGLIEWTVPALTNGDSVALSIDADVMMEGVFFSLVEIYSSADTDIDSSPGNGSLNEDDIASTCYSVPIMWYPGDEFTVSIPAPYQYGDGIVWYRNGIPITPSSTEATINPDSSLTIKAPGDYTFTTTVTTCPATGCCAIQIDAAPLSALGDYVWNDNNKNGVQDNGEAGVSGVSVYLFDDNGTILDTAITDVNGKYLFDNLIPGIYQIQFDVNTLPSNFELTLLDNGSDLVDSDAGIDGKTILINLLPGQIDTTWDAGIFLTPGFDLAMTKTSNATTVVAGGQITYTFIVYNQGNQTATLINLMDNIPVGLTLADANWNENAGIATLNTPIPSLAVGDNTTRTITFDIGASVSGTIQNFGEITSAKGPNGEDVTDVDSYPDNNPNNDGTIKDNVINEDGKNGGDEDDSDISTVVVTPAPVFDLALIKSIVSPAPYLPGQVVTFNVQVINQGSLDATQISLVDYIPSGLTLADGNWTNNGGKATYNFPLSVVVGQTNTVPITFVVNANASGTIINNAEISNAKGPNGENVTDVDSNPDNNPANDGTAKDNVVNEDGKNGGDEDDSDIESITITPPPVCETITSITASIDEICFGENSDLSAVSSNGTSIKWYLIPSGGNLQFTTNSGQSHTVNPTTTTVYYAELNTVAANCPNARVPVVVVVNALPSNPSCGNIIEICENSTIDLNTLVINGITSPGGTFEWHVSADPNSAIVVNTNVGPGKYYLFEKSGAGCYSNPAVAEIVSKTCEKLIDLSIIKIADRRVVDLNDIITYTITLNNAGPDVATNVVMEDILPAGLSFVSSSTWTNNAGVLRATFPTIAVNETKTTTYQARVISFGPIINVAQVISADQKDTDSTPGNASTLNEDDDDDEVINVNNPNPYADLSLAKYVSNYSPNVGDLVAYTIRITNSGPNVATNVEVTDNLPAGLTYQTSASIDASSLTYSVGKVTAKFNQIAVSEVVEFNVMAYASGNGSITNRAEVTKSDQQDPDSTPGSGSNEDDDDQVTITVIELCNPSTPLISCANPYICLGESTTLVAVNCNGTVIWSTGQSGSTITVTPTSTTIYTAICKIGNCESPNSNPVAVVVNNLAPPLVQANKTIACAGESVILTASGCTGSILWSNGSTGSSINVNPTVTTSYTARCKVATCLSNPSGTLIITITNGINAPFISASATDICAGQSVTLTSTGCSGTVNWSNGATGISTVVNPAVTSSYFATCSLGSCNSGNSNIVTINVSSGQTPLIIANNENICSGQTAVLTVSNCTGAVSWNTGASTTSITVNPSSNTTYTVVCGTGLCSGTASKTINVGAGQSPVIATASTSICEGSSATLSVSGCIGAINWSNGGIGSSIVVNPLITTIYTVSCSTGVGCIGTASMTINVSPKPAAPIVTCGKERICAGELLTFTAHNCNGTVNWSTGAVGTTTEIAPTQTRTYWATCTVNGCVSEQGVSSVITVLTETPTITASKSNICNGESVTLTAGLCSGTIAWSTGSNELAINVSPTVSTSYIVTCTVENCVGSASHTVNVSAGQTPTITASKTNICSGETVTLTATNCASTINWSNGSSGNTIIVSPTTTLSFTATCGTGTCAGSSSVTINVNGASTPSITASKTSICSGETVTLTAVNCASGINWSNGNSGNTITVSPTATASYTATCGTGTCAGSASITINVNGASTPTITASKTSICSGETVTLTAANCTSSISWSNGNSGNTITVSPAATASYTATCGTGTCAGAASITINVNGASTPTITASKNSICSGETATLTAANCASSISWSNGSSGNTITVSPSATTSYTATCGTGSCAGTAVTTISVGTGSTISVTASKNNICVGQTVTLTANGCFEIVNWSNGTTGTSINVSPITNTTYVATCGTGNCASTGSVTINIKVAETAVITASKSSVCAGESVTLTATGCTTGVNWSNGTTGNSITVNPVSTTSYTAECNINSCNTSGSITILVGTAQVPVITSSKSSVCNGEQISLTISNCTSAILWSTGETSTTINVTPTVANHTYNVTCGAGTCQSTQSIDINVGSTAAPVISANKTQLCDPGTVVFSATGCSGTVNWSNGATGTSTSAIVNANTSFTATCSNGNCISGNSNTINITVGKPNPPVITSNGNEICAGSSVILSAIGCTGTVLWSNGNTGDSINVLPSVNTTYTARCELIGTNCLSDISNSVYIRIITKPEAPVITLSLTRICVGDEVTLTAIGCSGTVGWNSGLTGSSITVSPAITTVYTANCLLGTCESNPSAPATINVSKPNAPIISSQNTLICSGSTTAIQAEGCAGTVIWSDGQQGSLITVAPTVMTDYSAVCDAGSCESDSSNIITVVVSGTGIAKPTVSTLSNTCPNTTVDLSTAISSSLSTPAGVFIFRTGNTPQSTAVTNPSAIATSGSFWVFESAGNGCFSPGAKIDVGIIACETNIDCETNPATANSGQGDTTICLNNDNFPLNGSIGGAAQIGHWVSSGNGTFDNGVSPITNYNFSWDDIKTGSVTLSLITNDPDNGGICKADTSSFIITINAVKDKPTISSDKSPNICLGDSVLLTVDQIGFNYKWSTGETTRSIVVKAGGDYTVKLINPSGCCSVSSETFHVDVNSSIVAPTVTEMASNVCPLTTVNLNNKINSQPSTANGTFEFHTGITPSSSIISNVSAVSAGTYYVFEKSSTGCYSNPSTITVQINNCNENNSDADVAVTIEGNTSNVTIGDEVTYTINVTNNGPATATNIHLVNTLPIGLSVNNSPGLNHVDNTLITTIPSLNVGESITFTYIGTLIKAGTVSNEVQITLLDQIDPVLSNNYDKFDVECATCQQICIGTALKADTILQSNGSYNIRFTALIEDCGNVNLTKVGLVEDMSVMFTSPTAFTMVQAPHVNLGSNLEPNSAYNGTTDINVLIKNSSSLNIGKTDTITWVINLVTNGALGPFSTNSIASGSAVNFLGGITDVSDVSNDGEAIYQLFADPTIVRLYNYPAVGLSLAIINLEKNSDNSFDVTYQALIKNKGSLVLNNLILNDTLKNTYKSPVTYSMLGIPTTNSGTLVINPDYNGNTDTRLTLSSSSLPIGITDTVWFKVHVIPGDVKDFNNRAIVEGQGTLADLSIETVRDISNTGFNPDAPGEEPTKLTISDENTNSIQTPCIGAALYMADSSKQADGSYNITFHTIIKNCGNLNLTQITMCDTLAGTYNSPTVATIVNGPTVKAGSTLSVNPDFDGLSNTCLLNPALSTLAPNKVDTVKWTINLILNSNFGPFRNNVTVTGKTPNDQIISDVSNFGTDPSPVGSNPLILNFNNLPQAMIGIAKKVESITKIEQDVYDLEFSFTLINYGIKDFDKVQVQDNLAATFGDNVIIDSVKITDVSNGLVANPIYTGKGQLINMLVDSTSSLPRNTTRVINLFTRIDISQADTSKFENMALAIGYNAGVSYDDQSTQGNNPDPDADGTPENNSIPTLIDLNSAENAIITPLGIAKNLEDTASVIDGSFIITYKVIVKNYGNTELTHVQLTDSLSHVFADSTDFALIGSPTLSANSKLKLNSSYDGLTDFNILVADSSKLEAGVSDTLILKVKVRNNAGLDQEYNNSIYGIAKDGNTNVTDVSNTGLNPDSDGDGNPGDNNVPTSITLIGGKSLVDTSSTSIAIPGGISPNGDGYYDVLVIDGLKSTDILVMRIYNRWGELVFKTEDYKALYPGDTEGWDGTTNTGIGVKSGDKLPDGTYFYSVESSNAKHFGGKPHYNFLTIAGGTQK